MPNILSSLAQLFHDDTVYCLCSTTNQGHGISGTSGAEGGIQ